MAVTVSGPELPTAICRRRLTSTLGRLDRLDGLPPVHSSLSWFGPAAAAFGDRATESTIQARSGLMAVHGWDAGRPQRLGLEVASAAAGVLASSGTLALLVGAHRGGQAREVATSVLQGGLLLVAHHLAAATADRELLPSPPGPEPGPPFCSADGEWFEIEVFEAEAWRSFWREMGAPDAVLGRAWTAFRSRYYRGICSFPSGLHQAAARATLAETVTLAGKWGVSVSRLRSYAEVLAEPGWQGGHLTEIAAGTGPALPVLAGDSAPLAGIRLVEATNRMQGPLAGLLLQMLGATVVRVEPPGGDVGRMVPPSCGDVGSFFRCYNRGKETVELDLATAAGRDDLRAVLAESDAFLHNWRPGRAERWGLDAPGLAKTNRRLVYAAASGWGDGPANSEIIGTDFLVQAYAGFGEGLHPLGEPPRTSRALLTDCMGALVTCEALLAALLHRARTGHGVAVGPSLLEGAMAAQAHVLDALGGGTALGDRRSPEGRPIWGPLDRPIATDDGYLAVGADEPADHRRLRQACQVAGEHRSAAADDAIAARLAEGTAEQWDKLLTEAGVPAAAVMTDLAALAVDDRFSSVVEPLSDTCRAPANPWTLTS